jgi:hypothetical protein
MRLPEARSMRRGVVTGCVVAGVALGATASPDARSEGATIRLTAVRTASRTVDVGAHGRSPGDLEIASDLVYDRGTPPSRVGSAQTLCTYLGGNARSCSARYVLPDGQIEAVGVIQHRLIYELAITGGTGLYDNARGDLVVTALGRRPMRELLVFRLVDAPAPSVAVQPASAPLQPPVAAPRSSGRHKGRDHQKVDGKHHVPGHK